MKRRFADLHLQPNLSDVEQTKNMLSKASELGYRLVAVPLPTVSIENFAKKLTTTCQENKLDFSSRLDLKPKTPRELTQQLRKFRRRVEIVAVICESKEVARQAAKDHRVDLLNFPATDPRKRFFDKAEAELASSSIAALEIDIKPLLTLKGPARIRLLAALRREVAVAKDHHVPIVISSGAASPLEMRKPMEMAALAALFDLDKPAALEAVSKTPFTIFKRNREKLKHNFVAPGIRLIREGSDCL
ncbi:MAG: RNase P subunit p30 family protein [Nitrososphaerota archaeon]|nr:RNase P subunit p30 family protein [Nitrososphaerota archaeon]